MSITLSGTFWTVLGSHGFTSNPKTLVPAPLENSADKVRVVICHLNMSINALMNSEVSLMVRVHLVGSEPQRLLGDSRL